MSSALETAITAAAANRVTVHKTHIIFSSPWCTSQTKVIKKEYDLPISVTRHTIEQLAKEAEDKFAAESKSDGGMIEHRIICTKLNGYQTSDPYNKKARSVEVVFLGSTVAKDVLESVHRIVGKYFHIRNNETSSFSLAAFSAISGILPAERDFLIVDIRGEVTDLSLVTDGVFTKNLSFPQGKDELVQVVANNSGQSQAAALSAINVAYRGDAQAATQTEMEKFAGTFKQTWLQSYTKALQDISAQSVTLFLIADSDVEMFFEKILNEAKKEGNLYLLKHLNARSFIDPSSVSSDPFLALESIFVTMT
jgi:cell division ATPase FtsA